MAINDTIMLEVIGTCDGQQHIHTLHVRAESTDVETELIADWRAGCRTAYRALFATADEPVQLLRARQVCGTLPLRAPVESAEGAGTRAGTDNPGTSNRAPSWLAVLTNHRTAFAGPSRRGRNFFGGLYEINITGNNLEPGKIATYEAYWAAVDAVFGATGTDNFRLVVHSPKLASVPGTQCQDSSTPITSHQVVAALASMKSRKPGRGN